MSRIAIHHPADPTRPKMVSEERFDPKLHTPWGDMEPEKMQDRHAELDGPPPSTGVGRATGFDSLPAEFPGKSPLEDAGITTIHGVRAVDDYDEIPGIGQVTEERILAYLDDLEAEE